MFFYAHCPCLYICDFGSHISDIVNYAGGSVYQLVKEFNGLVGDGLNIDLIIFAERKRLDTNARVSRRSHRESHTSIWQGQ